MCCSVCLWQKVGGVTGKLAAMWCTDGGLDGMMSSGIARREADWECASPPLHTSLSRHTHLLPGTIHAEIHAPPIARPHLPLPMNPDLSYEGEKVEEEEGASSSLRDKKASTKNNQNAHLLFVDEKSKR